MTHDERQEVVAVRSDTGNGSVERRRKRYGPICTVAGCDRPHISKGLCSLHYYRLRNSGTLKQRTCSSCDEPLSSKGPFCSACNERRKAEAAAERREAKKAREARASKKAAEIHRDYLTGKIDRGECVAVMRDAGLTLQQVADKFAITRERVRQIVIKVESLRKAHALREETRGKLDSEASKTLSRLESIEARAIEMEKELEGFDLPYLALTIDDLALGVRANRGLKNVGIKTVGELLLRSEADLLRTPNFGRKALNEVRNVLASLGLAMTQVKRNP